MFKTIVSVSKLKHVIEHVIFQLACVREPRSDFGIAWMPDSRLFAIGGNTGANGQTGSVEMLRCCNTEVPATTYATDTWAYAAPLQTARQCDTVLEVKFVGWSNTLLHQASVDLHLPSSNSHEPPVAASYQGRLQRNM